MAFDAMYSPGMARLQRPASVGSTNAGVRKAARPQGCSIHCSAALSAYGRWPVRLVTRLPIYLRILAERALQSTARPLHSLRSRVVRFPFG